MERNKKCARCPYKAEYEVVIRVFERKTRIGRKIELPLPYQREFMTVFLCDVCIRKELTLGLLKN